MSAVPNEILRPAQAPKDLPRTAPEAVRTFFSYTSPRVLLVLVTLALAARLYLGQYRLLDLGIALAIFAYWPINEWLIHVLILHHKPRTVLGRRWDYFVAHKHRKHHRDPWHLPLVFIPEHIFPLSIPALVGLSWLVTPDLSTAATFLLVYLAFSLHYEWVHYLAHIAWCPSLSYYQRRVREHRLHHFRNEKYWWGVSLGMGDRLFGTYGTHDSVPKSDTTGTLGIASR